MSRFAKSKNIVRLFSTRARDDLLGDYDCIIAGGGMVGATLACTLASNPLFKTSRILLVEAGPPKELFLPPTHSNRVSSINTTSKKLFDRIGMWQHIKSLRCQPIEDIKVWGYCSSNSTSFNHSEDDLAYVVENDLIISAAYEALRSHSNITIANNTNLLEMKQIATGSSLFPTVRLSDQKTYLCKLLISAGGAKCPIRTALNFPYISWTYNQSAVVATLQFALGGKNTTAWQRFTPDGPIALLPLQDGISSLVWSTSTEKAKNLLQLTEEGFVDELNKSLSAPSQNEEFVNMTDSALSSLLSNIINKKEIRPGTSILPPYIASIAEGSRAAFPLSFGHCSKYVEPHIALIGDAAHKVHPLAGQGVNLGLNDVIILDEVLSKGKQLGRVLGDIIDLEEYQTRSQRHNVPIMVATDFFHRLYVTDNTLLKAVGNAAFKIAETFDPIKERMKQFAAGAKII